MAQLAVVGQITAGQTALDHGITDMVVLETEHGAVLYTTSGASGGVTAYTIDANGALILSDFAHFSGAWSGGAMADLSIVETAYGTELVVAGGANGTLFSYALDGSGMIGAANQITGAAANQAGILEVSQWGGDMLFLTNAGQGAIQCYAMGPGNGLTAHMSVTDTHTTYADEVFALETLTVGGVDYLIGASQTEQGVSAYRIGPNGLIATGNMGIQEGLGIMTPTDMQVVEIGGRSFVLVASSPGDGVGQSGAITVLELCEDGSLMPTDHVIDTLNTRFGTVQSLEVVESNGRTFVIAAGGDDGLTLFVLMPNGRLQLVDVMADTYGAGLENVSSIAAHHQGNALHLFVSSEISPGVTEVTVDTSRHGETILSQAAGGVEWGTARDDIMIGGAGDDILHGSNGQDILEDGAGQDTLSGGYGYDIFVLRADGERDIITDFEWNRDQLDLSDWPFLYDPSQLSITSTATGAIVTWRGEYLEIHTHNGTSLTAFQVISAVSHAPNRLPTLAEIGSGASDQLLEGGRGWDQIDGGAGNDTVYGYDGNDRLDGGAGNDALRGGSGHDTLIGGTGFDTLIGADGNDSLDGGDQADSLDGGANSDTLKGGAGNDILRGGHDNDHLFGGDGSDEMFGDAGNDHLHGDADNDRLFGGGGHDQLSGGTGNDWLDGGADNDILRGGDGNDTLVGGAGHDRIEGGADNDNVWAGDGDDTILGEAHNDRLFAQGGNDNVHGGTGFDLLDGGDGDDLVDGGDQADNVWGGAGNDTIYGGNGHDRLMGGTGHDRMLGGSGRDAMFGDDGDDTMFGEGDNDNMWGSAGADVMAGGDGDDRMNGGAHADNIWGENGNDILAGASGDDRIWGGQGNDVVFGGIGHDTMFGDQGDDRLHGEAGDDVIHGGTGFDLVDGGDGNDTLDGGDQADNIWGGHGDDLLIGGQGLDRLLGGHGNDTLYGGSDRDGLFGGWGDDVIYGEGDADRIWGQQGRDTIYGGEGDDSIYAGSDFDMIIGGAGNDELWGNFNADTFVFEDGHGVDTIRDFEATNAAEKIDLSGISALNHISDVIGQNGAAAQIGAHVRIDTGTGFIWLTGVSLGDLDASDFIF